MSPGMRRRVRLFSGSLVVVAIAAVVFPVGFSGAAPAPTAQGPTLEWNWGSFTFDTTHSSKITLVNKCEEDREVTITVSTWSTMGITIDGRSASSGGRGASTLLFPVKAKAERELPVTLNLQAGTQVNKDGKGRFQLADMEIEHAETPKCNAKKEKHTLLATSLSPKSGG